MGPGTSGPGGADAISLHFGALAGLVAGSGATHRLVTAAITTIAYFVLGLVTSEVLFGWATEKELQPNVDGRCHGTRCCCPVFSSPPWW